MPTLPRTRFVSACLGLAVAAFGAAACGGGDSGADLLVYSGAEPNVLEPLVEQFEEANDVSVDVRTGDSPSLALQIDEEGDKSPADVFLSQSPGAVGFLGAQGRLLDLPDSILDRVSDELRPGGSTSVPFSGRVRTLVYNENEIDESELPGSIFDLAGDEYRGRVGVAPNNGSFIDFVSALRDLEGDERTADFLSALHENDAQTYPNNIAIVAAVARGEIDFGLVNHYYNEQEKAQDPSQPTVNYVFPDGDPGALLLTSSLAILDTGEDRRDLAEQFIAFLLSDESQQTLTDATMEYPVVAGVDATVTQTPQLADIGAPVADVDALGGDFEATRQMIADSGLAAS
jgi:iron(III) transport system substrate-binding protein